MTEQPELGNCCGHPAGPHVFVALESGEVYGVRDVPTAGVVLCPECDCEITWSVPGFPVHDVTPEMIAHLRAEVFGGGQ